MTIQEKMKFWADKLNGREYREEATKEEMEEMRRDGIIIAYGASDDLLEFDGWYSDELGAYEGKIVFWNGMNFISEDNDEEDFEGLTLYVRAKWCNGGYSFFIDSNMPYEPFEIVEGDEKYCRAIVLHKSFLNEKGALK